MAIPIPPDFDFRKEIIDPFEHIVRDAFHMPVDNWARFRYTIGIGTDPAHLKGELVSDDVKDAYRELGKCHYEVVLTLGYCNFAVMEINFGNQFVVRKATKDFYFHGGALLDNLARIIYIVNDPRAVSANMKRDGTGDYVRRAIDRSMLIKKYANQISAYIPHIGSPLIEEFSSVRNAMAHYWAIPFDDGRWPRDQLRDKAFAWPTHETKYTTYTGWTPFQVVLVEHFNELIKAQNEVFGLLAKDIARFEEHNNVTIAELDPPTTPTQPEARTAV
jgi:hypothetical protein